MLVWKSSDIQRARRNETYLLYEVQDRRYDQRRGQEMPVWKSSDIQRARRNKTYLLCDMQDR